MAWDDRFQPPTGAEEAQQAAFEQFLESDRWEVALREHVRSILAEQPSTEEEPWSAVELIGEVLCSHGGETFDDNYEFSLRDALDVIDKDELVKIVQPILQELCAS